MKNKKIMKQLILAFLCCTTFTIVAQTPYDRFASTKASKQLGSETSQEYNVTKDEISNKSITYDKENSAVKIYTNNRLTHTSSLSPMNSKFISVDPMADKYPGWGAYVYCMNNPVDYWDPDGEKVQVADDKSFDVLLSTLPKESRELIQRDDKGFISRESVSQASDKFSKSGNMQALNTVVGDERTVTFNASAESYNYINRESGATDQFDFQSPTRTNQYQEMMNSANTPEEKTLMKSHLDSRPDIQNKTELLGNLGSALRPSNAHNTFPGGMASTTNNFEVYVNPVGTTKSEQAQGAAHELLGHIATFFNGEDPKHGNEETDLEIENRELEAIINQLEQ